MTLTLIKKQLMNVFSWVYTDTKTGKRRTQKGSILYGLLYLLIFGSLAVVFFAVGSMMCRTMLVANMGWMYWCVMGLIAICLGVFGSVFNTYSSLYRAKDNDLLLSMPIPMHSILIARLSGVYATGLMYELIVMVPTVIVWLLTAPTSVLGVLCSLVVPFILSALVLVLSAVLGWVVAIISGRLKHKNVLTVLISLVFLAVYFYVYSRAYSVLQDVLVHLEDIGSKMKTSLYLLYCMGRAAEGDLLCLLIFVLSSAVLLFVVYFALSRSFIKLATMNTGTAKRVYREKKASVSSVGNALFKKELSRFFGSSNYMLNCGLGSVFMLLSAVLAVWKADEVRDFLTFLPKDVHVLVAVAAVCCVAAMNNITAPSVSLEGKELWLIKSLPVAPRQVLAAKLRLHLTVTLVAAVPLIAVAAWLVGEALAALLITVTVAVFVLLLAEIGLALNLKLPNLSWSSEIAPIKQSAASGISLFAGWILVTAFIGVYVLTYDFFGAVTFLVIADSVMIAASAALLHWIGRRGSEIFANL